MKSHGGSRNYQCYGYGMLIPDNEQLPQADETKGRNEGISEFI